MSTYQRSTDVGDWDRGTSRTVLLKVVRSALLVSLRTIQGSKPLCDGLRIGAGESGNDMGESRNGIAPSGHEAKLRSWTSITSSSAPVAPAASWQSVSRRPGAIGCS